ncbi:hypothetical protein [Maricaulis maris]|uniref:hypothetical protein n=1 Tax=Maricaulis maris TaxID=74318 RepID=UPI00291F1278|nr:hypothetical protein MACH15_26620 [Maricaulis maris]
MQLPNPTMMELLATLYEPCRNFGVCPQARWDPQAGHVPRGFLGATGVLEEVEMVLVFAEPGAPHDGEAYSACQTSDDFIEAVISHAYSAFAYGQDLMHRNTRELIDMAFPGMAFDDQLRKVWLTESRLCSLDEELGSCSDRTCAETHLSAQLELLPRARVITLGGKAAQRSRHAAPGQFKAYAVAPPGANHRPARPSWEAAASWVREIE